MTGKIKKQELDSSVIQTLDGIGSLNELATKSKENLVNAINETISSLRETSSISTSISTGVNLIETMQATPATVEFKGRTLVNLLGKHGGCEDLSTWQVMAPTIGNSSSLSTTVFDTGLSSIKIESTNSNHVRVLDYDIILEKNKYYLFVYRVFIESWTDISGGFVTCGINDKGNNNSYKYSINADRNNRGKWQTVFRKIEKNNLISTSGFRVRFGVVGASDSVTYFDSLRLYEVSDEDYNALGTTIVGDDVNRLFPYVDSVQHAQGLSLRFTGKNLVSTNPDGWEQGTVTTSGATGNASNRVRTLSFFVLPNQTYSLNTNNFAVYLIGWNEYTAGGTHVFNSGYKSTNTAFTTSSITGRIRLVVRRQDDGDFIPSDVLKFKPMLILGGIDQLPPSFEPRQDSYMNAPTLLASNSDGSVVDSYDSATKQVLRRWETGVKLDSIANQFILSGGGSGYISLRSPVFSPIPWVGRSEVGQKYNGQILTSIRSGQPWAYGDEIEVSPDGRIYVSIKDSDSGWVTGSNPTNNAISALLNGWKAVGYNGTNYTSWVSILDGSAPPTNTEAYVSKNKAPNWDTWATINYVRATPTVEQLSADLGGIALANGATQIELMDGVIVREKASPVLSSGWWYVNFPPKDLFGRGDDIYVVSDSSSGVPWEFGRRGTISTTAGYGFARILKDQHDGSDVFVTYRALDRHKLTAGTLQATLTYQSSIGSVLTKNTQKIASIQNHDGIQDWILAQHTARLLALEEA